MDETAYARAGRHHRQSGDRRKQPRPHSRHQWPLTVALGLMRLGARLPLRWQWRVGALLGDLMYRLLPKRRQVAATNIHLCFPELSTTEQQDLIRKSFRAVGIGLMEIGLSWWGAQELLRHAYRVEGFENLESARQGGRGVLLLGGHYTTLEIGGRIMARHVANLYPVYKPAHNPLFNAVMLERRRCIYDGLLTNTDLRAIVRALKSGKICWYAPDQDFGRDRSVFAPFMGVQTATLAMTMRLAKLSGAPVLPFYSARCDDGTYLMRFGAPFEGFPSGDDVRDATTINAAIERQVRETPDQYLWTHRRFKTRPPGEPALYAPR